MCTYQFSLLCVDGVAELQKSLKLVVLGEGYNLHYSPELTEDLEESTNSNRIRRKRDHA